MQQGYHVVESHRIASLAAAGLTVPQPWVGILDLLRMVEGHLPEPAPARPLGVVGLDALLRAVVGDVTNVLQALRAGLVESQRYFVWKQIPVVVLVRGTLEDRHEGSGLRLNHSAGTWPLAPMLGTHFAPVRPDVEGWYWAPQIG